MVVAFAPALVGQRVAAGSTLTVGVAAGLTMFVSFWLLTALYVRRANGEFDRLTAEIVKEASAPRRVARRARRGRRGRRDRPPRSSPRSPSPPARRWTATEKQPLNVHAIVMFLVFVALTMGIT